MRQRPAGLSLVQWCVPQHEGLAMLLLFVERIADAPLLARVCRDALLPLSLPVSFDDPAPPITSDSLTLPLTLRRHRRKVCCDYRLSFCALLIIFVKLWHVKIRSML